MSKLRIAVLISGNGTNLQSLIDACNKPDFPAEIVSVISNKQDAYGIERAKTANIPNIIYVNNHDYASREDFDDEVDKLLIEHKVQLVCLAGFMRILSSSFVDKWYNKLINIHPSLLPSFKGLNAQAQALEAGVKITGCTVHFVRGQMDVGPIIMQSPVEVLQNDDINSLTKRILIEEHKCYKQVVRLYSEGKISVENEKVVINL
ncbi:Phosphoribosylglycinamide formyltransferase [Rickettsiales bacterium Ac37b]|nr:Phosphoribosylglycinamide formyltransferase [Rickettsiales bacterium Ac37b]